MYCPNTTSCDKISLQAVNRCIVVQHQPLHITKGIPTPATDPDTRLYSLCLLELHLDIHNQHVAGHSSMHLLIIGQQADEPPAVCPHNHVAGISSYVAKRQTTASSKAFT